ncbi:uncharacterized protein LOC135463708 [Liolophura sinensis]|uniref:uncharacterized protein LOC135463708 n=1 Tax=Liolophura sinensis TaxID=3198878 RepID=UPI00315913AC
MTESSAKISQAGLVEKVGTLSDKMSKKSTNETSTKRVGKRGRRPSKVDVKVKLERSRQSARECRARKKLRYQYLEELVNSREKAVYALRSELEQFREVCEAIDNGHIPEGIESLLASSATPANQKRKSQKPVVKAESDSEETPYDILMDVLGKPGTSQQFGETSKSSPVGSDGRSSHTDDLKEMSPSSSSSESLQSSSCSPITPTQEDPRTTSFLNILDDIRGTSISVSDTGNSFDMAVGAPYEFGAIASPNVAVQMSPPSVFRHLPPDGNHTTSSSSSYNRNVSMDVDPAFQDAINSEASVSQIVSGNSGGQPVFLDATPASAPMLCGTDSIFYATPSVSTSSPQPFLYELNVSAVGQVTGDAQHDAKLLNHFKTTSSWYPSAVHDQPTNQIVTNAPCPEDIQEILLSTQELS